MKYTIASLVALACASSSFATLPGSTAAVTLALTASITTPGFTVDGELTSEKISSKTNSVGDVVSETTEYKTVVTTVRYGNAQIIADLNAGDMLDGTVSGWSIVSVNVAGGDSETGPSIYAVKKGQSAVAIELEAGELASAVAETAKSVSDYVKETTTVTGSGSAKSTFGLGLGEFSLQGILTGTSKYASGILGKGEDAAPYEIYLDGALRVAAFSGTYAEENVAEGSLSVAAAKIVDLETLGLGY